MTPGSQQQQEPADPVLHVVGGNPSAEEIAAVAIVLAAQSAAAQRAAATAAARAWAAGRPGSSNRTSQWSARWRLLRAPLRRDAGGWRASGLPR